MKRLGLARALVLGLTVILSGCQSGKAGPPDGTSATPGATATAPQTGWAAASAPAVPASPEGTGQPGAAATSPTPATGTPAPAPGTPAGTSGTGSSGASTRPGASAARPTTPATPGQATAPPSAGPQGSGHTALPGSKTVGQVNIRHNGIRKQATLKMNDSLLQVEVGGGPSIALENPAGGLGEAGLQVVPTPSGDHLLVTVSDGRVTDAWVLIPGEREFSVGLKVQVDWEVTVEGDAVRIGFRKYEADGGYSVRAFLFRYNEDTGLYESPVVPTSRGGPAPDSVTLVPLSRDQALYFAVDYPRGWPVVFAGGLQTVRIGSDPVEIRVLTEPLRDSPVPRTAGELETSGRWPAGVSARAIQYPGAAAAFEVTGTVRGESGDRRLLALDLYGGFQRQVVLFTAPPGLYPTWEPVFRRIADSFQPTWSSRE